MVDRTDAVYTETGYVDDGDTLRTVFDMPSRVCVICVFEGLQG